MASPRAMQIAEEEFRSSVLERLDALEAGLREILSILNPTEETEVDSDETFGDEAEAETTDDGTHGGFMDTEVEIDVTPAKRSKSKTL